MILSEERQSYLARIILDDLWKDSLIDFSDEGTALRAVKEAFSSWVKEEDNVDQIIRNKIASLKRLLVEGSSEWEVMYKKYYEEEMNRRG